MPATYSIVNWQRRTPCSIGPRESSFYTEALVADFAATGSVRDNPALPPDVRWASPTALDMSPRDVRMQAAIQRHIDAAVSKTINLPAGASVGDVRSIFMSGARDLEVTLWRLPRRRRRVLRAAAGVKRITRSRP